MLTTLDIWLNVRKTSGNPLLSVSGASIQEGGRVDMVAGDLVRLRLYLREFTSDGALQVVELPDGNSLVLAGKKVQDPGEELFVATDFAEAGDGDTLHYAADLSLNTTELLEAVESLDLDKFLLIRCDLEFQEALNVRRRTLQFDASLRQQVHSGGNPPDPADPPYPLPSDILLRSLSGSHPVAQSEQLVEIDLSVHGLSAPPARVLPFVRAPSADSPLIFVQIVGVPTADACFASLSAPAPEEGFIIDYLIIPGATP